jgi:hypothetical protein
MKAVFSLKSFSKKKIQGQSPDKWLASLNEISVHPREDGVLVKNVCCPDVQVTEKEKKQTKYVPLAGSVLLLPEKNPIIFVCGHAFRVVEQD